MNGKTFLYVAIGLVVFYFIYKEYVASKAATVAAAAKVAQSTSIVGEIGTVLGDLGGISGLEDDFGFGGNSGS